MTPHPLLCPGEPHHGRPGTLRHLVTEVASHRYNPGGRAHRTAKGGG